MHYARCVPTAGSHQSWDQVPTRDHRPLVGKSYSPFMSTTQHYFIYKSWTLVIDVYRHCYNNSTSGLSRIILVSLPTATIKGMYPISSTLDCVFSSDGCLAAVMFYGIWCIFFLLVPSDGNGGRDGVDRHVEGRGETNQGAAGETRTETQRSRGESLVKLRDHGVSQS